MALRWSSEYYSAMEHRDLQANAMAIDNTGTYILLAGRRYIAIRNLDDLDTENVRKFPRQSKYEVGAAEWNPSNSHNELCVISSNQRLEILTWRVGELTQTHSLRAHTRVITDLNWHNCESNLLASCSVDTFIHIWDIRDPRRPATSLSAVAEASQVRWNRVSPYLLATAHDGDVKLWDQRKGTAPVQYIAAHVSKIYGLDWSPHSDSQLVTSSQDSTIKFFDTNNARRAEFVLTTNAPVWRARFTPFGNGLITVVVPQLRRGENSLLLWNTASRGTPVHTFVGHRDVVLEFAWRAKKQRETDYQLVTWSKDQTLLVWRIEPFLQKRCGHDPEEVQEGDDIDREILAEDKSSNSIKVQPLEQEFSLLNVQIPNLDVVKMDATRRLCVVTASSNNYSVTLHITFPDSYPLGVSPIFQIVGKPTIDESTVNQVLQKLTQTSQQRVLKNRTCLEPCLRQFVTILEQLSNSPNSHSRERQNNYIDPDILGSFNDTCIPFPRTSGAKFCSVSILVCFGRHAPPKRLTKTEPTPRSLSALGTNFNQTCDQLSVFSYYVHKQRSRIKQSKGSQKAIITIYDTAGLFLVSKPLAEKYILDGTISRICKHNSDVAASVGRTDLVQAWTLTELAVGNQDIDGDVPWNNHPFGNKLMESMINHYASQSDIQTAAMFCCIFGKGQEEASKRFSLQQITSGTGGSPYHTIPPADIVADGWVLPLFRITRSNSLDNLKIDKLPEVAMIRTVTPALYEHYKLVYAEMLHRWGLLYNRAEVLKYLCAPAETHRGVEFVTDCQHCKQPSKNSSCTVCKSLSLNCVICHISVKGSANCCLMCGHGGHTPHLQQWFEKNNTCPTGCGCRCLNETAAVFSF